MTQKVGIIGIGNAGGQVADYAKSEFGIGGVALNTSNDDVSNIRNIDTVCIGDEKGAGKDRSIAKMFLKENIKSLLKDEHITDIINGANVIFLTSSTAGGSGSAITPVLTHILQGYYPNKHFIPVGILPPLGESVGAQQNTIDYMKELLKITPTYMLYDNEKYAKFPRDEMLKAVNAEIAADIAVIRGDYQFKTPYTSIDERDSSKIIETPGRLVVARVFGFKEKDLDAKGLEDRLLDTLYTNAHAELDRDQIIKRMGLITNLSEKIHKTFDPAIGKVKGVFGEPIEEFEHIYVNGVNDETNRLITIMSGLSVPDDRIEKIVQRIDEATSRLTRTKASSVLDTADTSIIKDLRSTKKSASTISDDSIDSMFNEFE